MHSSLDMFSLNQSVGTGFIDIEILGWYECLGMKSNFILSRSSENGRTAKKSMSLHALWFVKASHGLLVSGNLANETPQGNITPCHTNIYTYLYTYIIHIYIYIFPNNPRKLAFQCPYQQRWCGPSTLALPALGMWWVVSKNLTKHGICKNRQKISFHLYHFLSWSFSILIQDVSLKKLSPQLQQLGRPHGHPVSWGVGRKAEGNAQNPRNPTWILNLIYVKLCYPSKHPPRCLDVQHVLHWIWFVWMCAGPRKLDVDHDTLELPHLSKSPVLPHFL